MVEVAKMASRQLPLDQVHLSLGATMAERDGWSVPVSYGDELFEYASVRERGAGLLDLSARGRLLVSGSEAVAFINGLITNDMKTLAENCWMPAVFPNVQGRLLASVRVIRTADTQSAKDSRPTFVLDTEPATHDRVLQTIQKFTLAGDFHVTDLTSDTVLLSLQGKAAREKLTAALGETAAETPSGKVSQSAYNDEQVIVIRATHTAADGFDLIVKRAQAEDLWRDVTAAGARPVGYDALEMMRIEAGVPRYGQDMDDTTVVTETNLDDAVSYTKGCYVGQEIIARIKYRGHVAKKLRGLVFEDPATIQTGAPIKSADDKDIGLISSSTYSPFLGRRVAMGYVKYDYIATGTEVKTDGRRAHLVDLPLVNQTAAIGNRGQ
jgi:folate-binding protein YgfZ